MILNFIIMRNNTSVLIIFYREYQKSPYMGEVNIPMVGTGRFLAMCYTSSP